MGSGLRGNAPTRRIFFNSNNPKMTYNPIKASIGGLFKDILKIDTVASLNCFQFALMAVFVEKVEVYRKIISSYSFQDIWVRFFLHSAHN